MRNDVLEEMPHPVPPAGQRALGSFFRKAERSAPKVRVWRHCQPKKPVYKVAKKMQGMMIGWIKPDVSYI